MAWYDDEKLNTQQKTAIMLMRDDLRFLFTIMKNNDQVTPNYYISFLPFFGLIIDGIENWIRTYNNSSANGTLKLPTFSEKEAEFYEMLRESVKFWDKDYDYIYGKLGDEYKKANKYFASSCSPTARLLGLYDFIGVNTINEQIYGNTILESAFIPNFNYESFNGETIKLYAQIAGRYTALFGSLLEYNVNKSFRFGVRDYGGFSKLTFAKQFDDKFVLFSALCQIQFVIHCVDEYILDECATKVRFSYVLYYYLKRFVDEVNSKIGTGFTIDGKYVNRGFRNAMAHYGIGPALKESEIIETDILFGLTQKFFNLSSSMLKDYILCELSDLAAQIKSFLCI